jgi:hypothetical protein
MASRLPQASIRREFENCEFDRIEKRLIGRFQKVWPFEGAKPGQLSELLRSLKGRLALYLELLLRSNIPIKYARNGLRQMLVRSECCAIWPFVGCRLSM